MVYELLLVVGIYAHPRLVLGVFAAAWTSTLRDILVIQLLDSQELHVGVLMNVLIRRATRIILA